MRETKKCRNPFCNNMIKLSECRDLFIFNLKKHCYYKCRCDTLSLIRLAKKLKKDKALTKPSRNLYNRLLKKHGPEKSNKILEKLLK